MGWIKLDDGFFRHPKAIAAGRDGRLMFIASLCYCGSGLTDGFVPAGALALLAAETGVGKPKDAAAALVGAGLWEPCDGGYLVHDYLDYNTSSGKVQAERSAARERMQRKRSSDVRPNKPRTSPEVRQPETEEKQKQNDIPPSSPPEPSKPGAARPAGTPREPTDRQRKAQELYDRRMRIVEAYMAGLGIEPGTLPWKQREKPSLAALTPSILDSPECVPEVVEPLTRYARAAYAWRQGRQTPSLTEVLQAFAEWDGAGRPAAPIAKSRLGAVNGRHPPLAPVIRGDAPADGGLAEFRAMQERGWRRD